MTIIILFDDLLFNNKSRICLSKTRGETHIMITYNQFMVKCGKHWCMDMKLGGWGKLLTSRKLKVTSRSSGVIQGQMRSKGVNIGVWT